MDVHLLVKCSLWSFLNDCSCLIKLCYMGKPMSLANMDEDNHTAMSIQTM